MLVQADGEYYVVGSIFLLDVRCNFLIPAGSILGLLFNSENGGCTPLEKANKLQPAYRVSYSRR
jgi:hypothetical protein